MAAAELPFEDEARPERGDGEPALVVDVDGYEGPLDLLLDLARRQKVDLHRISILALAEQYLVFVEQARALRLELAADYLVMAAWLAYLKSRLLLPEPPKGEEPSAADLATALALRLRRLEQIREAARRLASRERLGQDVFGRGEPEAIVAGARPVWEAELYDLLSAYAQQRQRGGEIGRARLLALGRLWQEQPRFQIGEPGRHHQVIGRELEPQRPRRLDEGEILLGERQDRDPREVELLAAGEVQQEIERAFIAVDVDHERGFAGRAVRRMILLEWQFSGHGWPSPRYRSARSAPEQAEFSARAQGRPIARSAQGRRRAAPLRHRRRAVRARDGSAPVPWRRGERVGRSSPARRPRSPPCPP